MKTTTVCCDRCGAVILGGYSIIELTAGNLTKRIDGPIDLCGECSDRFVDFLRGPHQAAHNGVGTIGAVSAIPGSVAR